MTAAATAITTAEASSAWCSPVRNAAVAASTIGLSSLGGWAMSSPAPSLPPPVSTALTISDCTDPVMPISCSRRARSLVRWAFTSAPSAVTPTTAPIWRLVFVAEAAMPECAAGTWPSTAAVSGTTAMPKPTPATASTTASTLNDGCALNACRASRMPIAATTQPTIIGTREPARATHRPVSTDPTTIATAIGVNTAASRQPE